MNALTYHDYLGIAVFTIGLYLSGQIVCIVLKVITSKIISKYTKYDTAELPSVYYLLESSYSKEVTMSEVEKELQLDIERGVITSYTIGEDFIVYRQKGGRKNLIDLSKYDVE